MKETLRTHIKTVCKTGDFTLTSGMKSDFYIDIKSLLLNAYTLSLIAGEVYDAMCTHFPNVEYIGGMELGSPLISSAVATHSVTMGMHDVNQFVIRKAPRTHGTKSQVEGIEEIKGKEVVLVDDVLTTGGSIDKMRMALRDHCKIVGAIIVVHREDVDLIELIQKNADTRNYPSKLIPLYTKTSILG